MAKSTISPRLTALRQQMQRVAVDYYYVPTADPHHNEYVPACWQRRHWISDFSGSAGEVLVSMTQACLWTDGRYFVQAEQQLDATCYQLIKPAGRVQDAVNDYLSQHAKGKTCGVDPQLINIKQADALSQTLASVNGRLTAISDNLIDRIWQDQPPIPISKVSIQPEKYAGVSAQQKIQQLRAQLLQAHDCQAQVISALDEIAWLLNIRGNDIPYNPLSISYAVVSHDQVLLFIDENKPSKAIVDYLTAQGVTLKAYEMIATFLSQLRGRVLLDPDTTSWWLAMQLTQAQIVSAASPLTLLKSCKNTTELRGTQAAHQRDGVALVKFAHWLEQQASAKLTEYAVAQQLEQLRAEDTHFLSNSFPTICGFGSNSAIVHYQAQPKTTVIIDDSNLLLIDSGAQYRDGTTDVTRVYHLGAPTAAQKKHYTLVLKGHLALRHAVFPSTSCGEHLDVLARQYLWQHGLDYSHGTGHGVGVYLCVHEGPQSIAPRSSGVPLQPGMLVSNEPGVYLTGQYGIRIENVCQIVPAMVQHDSLTEHGSFYTLSDLTMAPYNHKLINISLLTALEIDWIDQYHQTVRQALSGSLSTEVRGWLDAATQSLASGLV